MLSVERQERLGSILEGFFFELLMITAFAKENKLNEDELWLCWCHQKSTIWRDNVQL